MTDYNNIKAFFALLRAGLWGKDVQLAQYGEIDFATIQRIAEEQSVVGLIAAGMEHIVDTKPTKKDVLQFIGQTLQIEERNKSMNYFIGVLVDKMKDAGIFTLLVKGQGVAQCYEKPLWRACGDVDFFLDDKNYMAAQRFLTPLATSVDTEGAYSKHIGLAIDPWVVELHGTMRCGLSSRMDKALDKLQEDCFKMGAVRVWKNGETEVYLPSADNDIIFVFTHFLKHFYKGGIGLRQICDWCMLLWTYRAEINVSLLEKRLHSMGLMSEWKAFGAYAVEFLGMPVEALPAFESSSKWNRKAKRINRFILKSGNFGHSRDNSYYSRYPYVVRKCYSMGRRLGDIVSHSLTFPLDALRYMPRIIINGLRSAANGE